MIKKITFFTFTFSFAFYLRCYPLSDLSLSSQFIDGLGKQKAHINTLSKLIQYTELNGAELEVNQNLQAVKSKYSIEALILAFSTTEQGQYFKYNTQRAQEIRTQICLANTGFNWGTPEFFNDPLLNSSVAETMKPASPEYISWFNDVANAVFKMRGHINMANTLPWCGKGGGW